MFLLSSVVWTSVRSTQNREMKNLRFYGLKILGCISWWLFYDDYYYDDDYHYDDFMMMIIIMMMIYDDNFVLKMLKKNDNDNENKNENENFIDIM